MHRAACVVLLAASCSHAAGAPAPPPAPAGPGPVLVELFTSQGCSSCPPADRWLGTLRPGDRVAGRAVVPLAFHVDYWNDLGWADPWSSAAWSDRQGAYGRRFGDRVYTPELVIGGRTGVVASKPDDVAAAIAAAPAAAALDASLTRAPGALHVRATAPAGATAWAAVVEDGLVTEVHAGENAGARAVDDHVVRALVAVPGEVTIPLDPAWGPVRVVAFAVDADGAVVAVSALP